MVEGGEGCARLVDPLPDLCSIADTCSTTHDLLFHSSEFRQNNSHYSCPGRHKVAVTIIQHTFFY